MNRLLALMISGLLGLCAAAQTPEDFHFSVKDSYVTWQLVYDESLDADAVLGYLLGSGNFADVTAIADGFSFTITPQMADWRSSEIPRAHVPIYILNYQMTAHGLLQIRDGRYRVTVDHVVFQDEPGVPLETYAINKKSEFRSVFSAPSSNAAAVLDHSFTKMFTFQENQDEDW